MIIELKSDFIEAVRHHRSQYPNNEIGYCIKKTNGTIHAKMYKGEINTVSMPVIKECFNIHTHPDRVYNNNAVEYSPPSGGDLMVTITNTKKDNAVFDKHGIWVYRPNRALVRKINKFKKIIDGEEYFDEYLYKSIQYFCRENCHLLYSGEIDLKEYLNSMRCFNLIDEDKEEYDKKDYGFIIKFYPYENLTNIKLYMDNNHFK